MQCGHLKKAITTFSFVSKIIFFVKSTCLSESIPMTLTRETNIKHILCQTVVKKKEEEKKKKKRISFSSIMEGNLIYFFKYFFHGRSLQVGSADIQVC